MSVLARLDRLAARFNRYFGATEVAVGAEHMGAAGGPPVVDPAAVVAVMGEIEREGADGVRGGGGGRGELTGLQP